MKIQKFTDIEKRVVTLVKKHPIATLFCVAILVTIFLAFFTTFTPSNITFNQNYEEKNDRDAYSQTWGERFDMAISNYSARINSVFGSGKNNEIDVADPDSVFEYVFSKIPYYAVVYPTEMYYYFNIPGYGIPGNVSGNLNFKEIKDGKLSFAYFDTTNLENSNQKMFGAADGLATKIISENMVRLSYKGKTVWFKLPKAETDKPASLNLIPDEEFVTKVRDESGTRFWLVFNKKTNSFYFLVNTDFPMMEAIEQVKGGKGEDTKIKIGQKTNFAYYIDAEHGRKILFGVNSDNIMKNNYFDGPFDQVPPRLEIRDRLYKAYPYTQYMHGLDPYGNFIDWAGSRVAISPYVDYVYPDFTDLKDTVKNCQKKTDPSDFWSCLTYETKKDFHKTIPEFFYPDGRKKK